MRKIVLAGLLVFAACLTGCQDGEDDLNANVAPGATPAAATAAPSAVTPAASSVDIQKLSSVGKSKAGGIDVINGRPPADAAYGKIDAAQTPEITISGWVIDDQTQKPAEGLFVSIDGTQDFPATYGIDRKDVADYFKNPAIRYCGFRAAIPAAQVAKGRHTVVLKIVKGDKSGYYESERRTNIEVK